jgi:hypothetical protein
MADLPGEARQRATASCPDLWRQSSIPHVTCDSCLSGSSANWNIPQCPDSGAHDGLWPLMPAA